MKEGFVYVITIQAPGMSDPACFCFSDKKNALTFAKKFDGSDYDCVCIDEYAEEMETDSNIYRVIMRYDGELISAEDVTGIQYLWDTNYESIEDDRIEVILFAKSEKEAIEYADHARENNLVAGKWESYLNENFSRVEA